MYYSIAGTKIIYFLHSVLISYGISLFYTRVLTPKKFLRHPLGDCFIITLLLNTVMTFSVSHAVFTSIWFFSIHLLIALFLFKDRMGLRITAYAFVMVSYSFIELLPASILIFINIFLPSMNLTPKYLIVSGNVLLSALNCFSLAIIYFLFLKTISGMLYRYFSSLKPKSLLLVSMPFFIVMINTYFLEKSSTLTILFLVTPLIIINVFLCLLLLQKGLLALKHEEELLSEKENHKKHLEQQIDYYKTLDKEYLTMRRWRHDVSNHLVSVAYLLETKQYNEAGKYLDDLSKKEGTADEI